MTAEEYFSNLNEKYGEDFNWFKRKLQQAQIRRHPCTAMSARERSSDC